MHIYIYISCFKFIESSTQQPPASLHPFKTHLTAYQKTVLEEAEKKLPTLGRQQRAELAKGLDLSEQKVYRWFLTQKKQKLQVSGNTTTKQVECTFAIINCTF